MATMTQSDIRAYYQDHWKGVDQQRQGNATDASLRYSSPVQDAVLYPIYERLIADLSLCANGRVLDVGCGAGRWIRFFQERFQPTALVGADFAQSSVDLLTTWSEQMGPTNTRFIAADITADTASLQALLPQPFDLINVGNVLFHIPENDKHGQALVNLSALMADDGAIVTTEYLPRLSMRTEWMLVRSRYEFEHQCAQAGLRIAQVRACTFFTADPMGFDGPDSNGRVHFLKVRAATEQLLSSAKDPATQNFLHGLMAEIELACMSFCSERVPDIEMPSQKLVVLKRA
jgi:SAM-dependent methyltransferase